MSLIVSRRLADPLSDVRRLVDEAFTAWPFVSEGRTGWMPPTDITETPSEVKLEMELPGLRPDEVKLSVENRVLTIQGEKRQEVQEKEGRSHRTERVFGVFARSFRLPETVSADGANATFANGVLTVTLPRAEAAKPREITVKQA